MGNHSGGIVKVGSGAPDISLWDSFLMSSQQPDGLGRTLVLAVEAGHALLGAVVVHSKPPIAGSRFHGTDPVAGGAIYTGRSPFRKNGSNSVEQRQAGPERTDYLAKESPMPHGEDHHRKEDGQPHTK